MKAKVLLGIALAFAATSIARADIVIEQTIESSVQPTSKMTMKIKGTKLRTDVGDQMTSIVDTATFDSVTLMHPNKTIIKGNGDQLKAAAAAAAQDLGVKPVDTGKTEKVGGYKCSVWTVDVAGSTITIWATKDYPDYAAIKAEFDTQTKASGLTNHHMAAIDGMVLKTVANIGGTSITTTLNSARKTPVDDSEFVTPDGYTEMKLPQ
jgi:hypothetical protein